MVEQGINQVVIVTSFGAYILSISNLNIIQYSVTLGFLSIFFVSGILILNLKSFEDHLIKYTESTMYSGGTDWISRTSLLIGYFLYSVFLIFISAGVGSIIGYAMHHTLYFGFPQFSGVFPGSFIGSLVSLIYLLRILSESSIYSTEKLPTKTFLGIEVSSADISLQGIVDEIISSLEYSEFFHVLEKHVSISQNIGKIFLRTIYTQTIGVGVDIYVQVSRSGEVFNVLIDLDPWSVEELPQEALSSVPRIVLSRIQGVLQTKIMSRS